MLRGRMSPRLVEGVIAEIGRKSRKPPQGARKHCVRVSAQAARCFEGRTASLRHGHTGEVAGQVTEVWIDGKRIRFRGWVVMLPGEQVSYGIENACIANTRARTWEITRFDHFDHLAILPAGTAAHAESWIR